MATIPAVPVSQRTESLAEAKDAPVFISAVSVYFPATLVTVDQFAAPFPLSTLGSPEKDKDGDALIGTGSGIINLKLAPDDAVPCPNLLYTEPCVAALTIYAYRWHFCKVSPTFSWAKGDAVEPASS